MRVVMRPQISCSREAAVGTKSWHSALRCVQTLLHIPGPNPKLTGELDFSRSIFLLSAVASGYTRPALHLRFLSSVAPTSSGRFSGRS